MKARKLWCEHRKFTVLNVFYIFLLVNKVSLVQYQYTNPIFVLLHFLSLQSVVAVASSTNSLNRIQDFLKSSIGSSVGVGETWSLGWEWGSFASIESGAPSSSFAHSGASAFPGLNALLGTLPVVGLGNGAVVIMWSGLLVSSPVSLIEHLGVIEIEEVELILLSGGGGNKGGEDGDWGEFHL